MHFLYIEFISWILCVPNMSRRSKRVGRQTSGLRIYIKTSSVYNAILCFLLLTRTPYILQSFLIACTKGSMCKKGCWGLDLSNFMRSVRLPFILILAVWAEYKVLIPLVDFSAKPNHSKIKNKHLDWLRQHLFWFYDVLYYIKRASNIILCLMSPDKTCLITANQLRNKGV